MNKCSWPAKPSIRSPDPTPVKPASVCTRTMVASQWWRGLVSQLAWKGGSNARRCCVISIAVIVTFGTEASVIPYSQSIRHGHGGSERSCLAEHALGEEQEIGIARLARVRRPHRGVLGARHLPGETFRRDAGEFLRHRDLE